MHIKNIIISGFRSYRDQAFQEELSPKHNVVVGRNGSGKSNFFAAIQFVLSEKFANLSAAERKDLFHAGAGRPLLAVFVEIVFDNSDGRIVIPGRPDETEVRIRRTVGLKQDEFRVNDRRFSSTEIRQLLESAGFSSSNPYYIVEQGKIVSLANMNEDDRYQLIKDVAGTKVYESRRSESELILNESEAKVTKIDEAIKQLEDRLAILEAETTELRAFQLADRNRRAIEYSVYHSELLQAKVELTALEKEHQVIAENDEVVTLDVSLKQEEQRFAAIEKQTRQIEAERMKLEKERTELVSRRALLALKVDDAKVNANNQEKERNELKAREKEMRKGLQATTRDLDQKNKLVSEAEEKSNTAQKTLDAMESELEFLQAKRGRKNQFKSKADRDAWIREEIARNKDVIDSNSQEIKRLNEEERKVNGELNKRLEETKTTAKNVTDAESTLHESEGSRVKLLAERDALNAQRRKLWSSVQEKEQVVRRYNDTVESNAKQFEKCCRLDIRQGILSMKESLAEIGDKHLSAAVHGQIIDLISVEEGFDRAVDVTGGNALFNVIVDSFQVSERILDHMNKRKKPGRVTFFPLDTCKSTPRDIPTTPVFSGLISHITYDKKFASVMAELFGRTAVTQSLEAATNVVRDLDVDAVTRDGDQFSRKGGITGGYIEKRTSRFAANMQLRDSQEKLRLEKESLDMLCQRVAQVEQAVTELLQKIESSASHDASLRANVEGSRLDTRSTEDRCHRLKLLAQQNSRASEVMQKASENLRRANVALSNELVSDFKATLSAEEDRKLEQLQQQVAGARGESSSLQSRLVQFSTEQELLRGQLHYFESNLASIEDRLATLGGTSSSSSPQLRELASIDEEIRLIEERINLLDATSDKAVVERKSLEDKLAMIRGKLASATRVQQDEKDKIERSHNQRTLLLRKKDDASSKIRKLGIVPPDVERYSSYSMGKLMHLLRGAQEEMKKFAHVNKKAVDQYTSLVETRNELAQQKKELQQELRSILDLIKHLDERKDEAIQRTYKQVQYNFEKVFEELVHAEGASAELQLVRNTDRTASDPYSAVRVQVNFGVGNAVSELNQLSGGQKSLVALGLIFAIQRCDPAPFYLFDEIDAALDAEYRTAVANVIRKQSESCQFITATFKLEMLEAADSVLGIFFNNKVSRIQPISREEGQGLLKRAAMDERKRGREGEEAN